MLSNAIIHAFLNPCITVFRYKKTTWVNISSDKTSYLVFLSLNILVVRNDRMRRSERTFPKRASRISRISLPTDSHEMQGTAACTPFDETVSPQKVFIIQALHELSFQLKFFILLLIML